MDELTRETWIGGYRKEYCRIQHLESTSPEAATRWADHFTTQYGPDAVGWPTPQEVAAFDADGGTQDRSGIPGGPNA